MTAFDKFEKARLKGNNACPCCKRGMDTQTEAVYLQELGKLLRKKFFDNKAAVESQAESGRIILEKVRGISSWLIEAGDLELEMKDVITQEAQRDQERRKCAEAETKLGSSVKLKEDQLVGLNELFVEMGALRRRWSDLSARFSELQEKQTRHSQTASTLDAGGRTYQEVEDALQAKTHEREKLELRKEQLQGEENKATKKMYTLRAMLADAEKVLSEAKGKEERLRAAQLKRTELEAAAVRIAASKAELTAKLSISQNEVRGAERALQQAKENLQSLEESWNMKTQLSRSDLQDFRSLNDSLRAIQQKCDKTDLSVIDKELSAARRDIESKEEQLKSLTEARVEALQRLQNEERTRKLIVDNLELRRAIREQSMLQEKLSVLRARLEPDKRRVEEATREVSRATQERGKLLNEEATIVGRVRELEEQLKELDAKIMSPTYRDIAKRHRRKNIEYETTLMAVADLDTYYNALDSALATYHTLKIKEINKIIRELWQQVYRGDDIDRIEISSDQDFDTSAGTSKRAYNYRVVMTKGNTPLDMRGRCSAGQRVLAAIVIRLALAETFCLTCGSKSYTRPQIIFPQG